MKKIDEAANYCLNCKTKPCSIKGCPMETDIPEFITEIKNNNYKKAYDILMENNILSHVCSLVCPQEEQCEGSCIRNIKSNPTSIGKLEKFVNEWAKENGYKYEYNIKEKNGKKVAVIGTGPAGLECGAELLKNGFEVDFYEKDELPGGILVYGIPDFRLSKDLVEEVINTLKVLGGKFYLNTELGKDIFIEKLQNEYDAIFLGTGAIKQSSYSLTEEENKNIYLSDVFLKAYNNKEYINSLGTLVVIGGGNVAMDSARAAKRMGAEKVKILYRRDRAHMPAREAELEEVLNEGIEFKELTRVASANINNGKIESVNCVKTEIVNGKAVDKTGEDITFVEEANTVVFAIGQKTDKALLENQKVLLNDWGMIIIDENGKTNLDKVYAGGDNTEEKATVCRALAAGKRAAKGIIKNV